MIGASLQFLAMQLNLHLRRTMSIREDMVVVSRMVENDGKDYPFFYSYIMPDEDVIMTAIWEPLNYIIVFNPGVSSIPSIKINGKTGGVIIAPYLENKREGYTFVGWKLYDKELYYPGDEIIIIGQLPGLGISARGIWRLN